MDHTHSINAIKANYLEMGRLLHGLVQEALSLWWAWLTSKAKQGKSQGKLLQMWG